MFFSYRFSVILDLEIAMRVPHIDLILSFDVAGSVINFSVSAKATSIALGNCSLLSW